LDQDTATPNTLARGCRHFQPLHGCPGSPDLSPAMEELIQDAQSVGRIQALRRLQPAQRLSSNIFLSPGSSTPQKLSALSSFVREAPEKLALPFKHQGSCPLYAGKASGTSCLYKRLAFGAEMNQGGNLLGHTGDKLRLTFNQSAGNQDRFRIKQVEDVC